VAQQADGADRTYSLTHNPPGSLRRHIGEPFGSLDERRPTAGEEQRRVTLIGQFAVSDGQRATSNGQ
jgi:hypothetical protein